MSKERLEQEIDTSEIQNLDSTEVQDALIIKTLGVSEVTLVIPEYLSTLTLELLPLNLASDLLTKITYNIPPSNVSIVNLLPLCDTYYDVSRIFREEQMRKTDLLYELSNPLNTTVRIVAKDILNIMLPEDTISNIESFLEVKKIIVSLPYNEWINLVASIKMGHVPVGRNIYENLYVEKLTLSERLNESNVTFSHLVQDLNSGVAYSSLNGVLRDVIIPAPHENDFATEHLLLTGQDTEQVTE